MLIAELLSNNWHLVGLGLMTFLVSMDLYRKYGETVRVIDRSARSITATLQRPSYRPRWRFPFRTLRTASLWVIVIVVVTRGSDRCTPAPRPVPATVDCSRDSSPMVQVSCALTKAVLRTTLESLRR